MDTKQMQDVISSSPIMIQAASSVGGSKLTATSLDAFRAMISPSPSSSPAATAAGFFVDIRAAIGGGIGAFALLCGIAFGLVMYMSDKKRVKAKDVVTEKKNRVMVIVQEQQHMNPIVNTHHSMVSYEHPVHFSPEQTRSSSMPLRVTNKGSASWGTRV
jgi:hypothetical protein